MFVRNFVEISVLILSLLILGRVLISWVDATGRSRLSIFLFTVTEPILAPVRRLLPRMGMLDLSPMIVLFVLSFVLKALH